MYLDSGILIKLLTPEPDSGFFAAELRGKTLGSSELAYTEVGSALLAKERAGRLPAAARQKAWKQFLAWINAKEIVLHRLNELVVLKAAHHLELCHPHVALRTLDALHLATADLTQDTPLCTTDERLRQAAQHLRMSLFPAN